MIRFANCIIDDIQHSEESDSNDGINIPYRSRIKIVLVSRSKIKACNISFTFETNTKRSAYWFDYPMLNLIF